MWNLVGFQTRLRYPEQQRVFRLIPGLENAEFLRFGSIHRNSYLNAPAALTPHLALKDDPRDAVRGPAHRRRGIHREHGDRTARRHQPLAPARRRRTGRAAAHDDDARRAVSLSARGRSATLPADERELRPRGRAGRRGEGQAREEGEARRARARRTWRSGATTRSSPRARARSSRGAQGRQRSGGSAGRGNSSRRRRVSAPPRQGARRLAEHGEGVRARPPRVRRVSRRLLRHGGMELGGSGPSRDARLSRAPRARGVGKRTMARTLSGVRSFYRWMHRNEMVEANPARAVGAPKQDKYLPGYLDRAADRAAVPDGRDRARWKATSPTCATSRSSSCSTPPACACRSFRA